MSNTVPSLQLSIHFKQITIVINQAGTERSLRVMQKPNRKKAPPGFLTAKDAMTAIGVSSTTFYDLVKSKIIPGVVLPGRKEAVYPEREVQRYIRSLRAYMDMYTEDTYDFGLALKSDIPEIRTLVADATGGYAHTVPQDVMEAWIRKNPEAVHVLRKGAEIVGYISMFPLPFETIMQRLSGKLLNRNIPLDDIQPFIPGVAFPLYVAEVAVKQHVPQSTRLGALLLGHTEDLLVEYAQQGIIFDEVYAVGTSEFGIRLCRSLGMQVMGLPEGMRQNRIPFRLDVRESTHSRLVDDYRKVLK